MAALFDHCIAFLISQSLWSILVLLRATDSLRLCAVSFVRTVKHLLLVSPFFFLVQNDATLQYHRRLVWFCYRMSLVVTVALFESFLDRMAGSQSKSWLQLQLYGCKYCITNSNLLGILLLVEMDVWEQDTLLNTVQSVRSTYTFPVPTLMMCYDGTWST